MIRFILLITLLVYAQFGFSQVGISTTAPQAQLDIRSSNQATPSNTDGLLIPKIDVFPATNPSANQQGMMVYLTSTVGTQLPGFYYWDNLTTSWIGVGAQQNWGVNGNSGTNTTTNFIGTKDNQSLVIRTDNTERVKIDNTGNIGLGGVNPIYPLEFKSTIGDKICLYNTGPLKSYGLGISNSLLQIFSSNAGSSIGFGYGSSTSFTENVRFTGFGNVGIGTSNPFSKLHIKTNATGMTPNVFASAVIEDDQFTFLNLLSNQESGVVFGSNGLSTSGAIIYSPTSMPNALQFRTNNNTNRMTISDVGNVAIGDFKSDFPLQFEGVNGDKISLWGGPGNHYGFGIQPYLLQIHAANITDDITFGYGNSAAFIENVRFTGSGNVGIGAPNPSSKFQINASNQATPSNTDGIIIPRVDAFPVTNPTASQNGMMVFLTTAIGTKQPGFYYWNHATTTWLGVGAKSNWTTTGNSGTNPTTHYIGTSDNNDVSLRANATEVLRLTSGGNAEVSGFTKLGASAPAIKVVKLTSTTSATQGTSILIPHGVSSTKILDISALVEYFPGSFLPDGYTANPGYEFQCYINGAQIVVINKTGNSGFVLSKPIRVLVTYEQ